MIRRTIRLGFCAGVLAGLSFALFKFVQSRRASHELPPTSDWLPAKRPEKPLIDPEMLHGLALKKDAEPTDEPAEPVAGDGAVPVAPVAAAEASVPIAVAPVAAWVEPEDGACPVSHPIKAKLTSGIFHLPGMLAYDRTVPDRCYLDEAAAESDGLRRAKR